MPLRDLTQDVHLCARAPLDLEGRVSLCAGTREPSAVEHRAFNYRLGARLPRGEWETLAPHDPRLPPIRNRWEPGHSLGVVQLSERLVARLRSRTTNGPERPSGVVEDELVELARYCEKPFGIVCVGPTIHLPACPRSPPTCTLDPVIERVFTGTAGTVPALPSEPGVEPAFRSTSAVKHVTFFFLGVTMERLCAKYSSESGAARTLVDCLRDNPDYPVMRLRVEPGEAYIAPTENLVHDATTLGKTKLDVQVTLIGHFSLRW